MGVNSIRLKLPSSTEYEPLANPADGYYSAQMLWTIVLAMVGHEVVKAMGLRQ